MRKPISLLALAVAVGLATQGIAQEAKPAPDVADDFVRAEPRGPVTAPLAAGLERIRVPALAASIAFLASPSLEGRGLGSRGLEAASGHVVATLAAAGVPPLAGDGSGKGTEAYFQEVPVREITLADAELTVEARQGEEVRTRSFRNGVDCVFPEFPPGSVTAPVVFAGYGIREEKLGRDDYSGLAVRGRIVLVLAGLPPGEEWQKPELVARYAAEKARDRYEAKVETARALGAVAVLGIEGGDFATRVVAQETPAPRFFLPFEGAGSEEGPPVVRVSTASADAMLAVAGLDSASAGAAKPAVLPGVTATIRATGTERLVVSRNVVAFIAGSDPRLREDAVVIGAHMDHLGRVGDVIYPGADDNASGVSALQEIAGAFAAAPTPPARTIVFTFWTGEEEGKFGSGWWVRHPLWPLKRTVAYLNLDMIAHPWSMDEIRKLVADTGLPEGERFLAGLQPADFAEPGVADWSPELAEVLRRAGPAAGLALHLDRTDGKSGGSDYRDFARAGVPWVRFFGNFFPGYHEPADTPEQTDAEQVRRMARLCFATAWLLANP
jgi:hypothetical protein